MCRLTGSVTSVMCPRSRRCTLSTGGQEPASLRRSRSSLRASCPTELSRMSQQMLPPLLPREPLAGAEEIKPFSSVPCASGSSLSVSQRAPAAFRAGCPPGLLNKVWKYALFSPPDQSSPINFQCDRGLKGMTNMDDLHIFLLLWSRDKSCSHRDKSYSGRCKQLKINQTRQKRMKNLAKSHKTQPHCTQMKDGSTNI